MKAKLNISIDQSLIPTTKKFAREHGLSVSELVEQLLRNTADTRQKSFSDRWRGRFKPSGHSDARYQALSDRYLK